MLHNQKWGYHTENGTPLLQYSRSFLSHHPRKHRHKPAASLPAHHNCHRSDKCPTFPWYISKSAVIHHCLFSCLPQLKTTYLQILHFGSFPGFCFSAVLSAHLIFGYFLYILVTSVHLTPDFQQETVLCPLQYRGLPPYFRYRPIVFPDSSRSYHHFLFPPAPEP